MSNGKSRNIISFRNNVFNSDFHNPHQCQLGCNQHNQMQDVTCGVLPLYNGTVNPMIKVNICKTLLQYANKIRCN